MGAVTHALGGFLWNSFKKQLYHWTKEGCSLPNWAYRGMCCQKGIAFGVSSLYKVFTILLLDFLNKKCFWKLWITLKQASVIYMNILLVTEWSCYAKINNKFLIIKGGGRKRILFLNKKRLFRPKLHTPTQTLCNTPSPLLLYSIHNTMGIRSLNIFCALSSHVTLSENLHAVN